MHLTPEEIDGWRNLTFGRPGRCASHRELGCARSTIRLPGWRPEYRRLAQRGVSLLRPEPLRRLLRGARRVRRVLEIIAELIVDVASYVRERTGSCSIAVTAWSSGWTRLFIHANCSVQMISPHSYRALHLPVEQRMAARIQPFGIHHCGNNMQRVAPVYAEPGIAFADVGWGSDLAACRAALPDTFLNLRLSPVRMLTCTPQEMVADVEQLLRVAGPLDKTGLCCINMDYGRPTTTCLLCTKSWNGIGGMGREGGANQRMANQRIGESANRRISESANQRINESANQRIGGW